MSSNGAQGSQDGVSQAAGEVKEKVAALADATRTQVSGKSIWSIPAARRRCGAARASVAENPFVALAAALAAGFAFGALWAWRRE